MFKNKTTFKCKECGCCCKYFGLSKTLPVFSFEIPKLQKQAKKHNKKIIFVPENILLDKKSGILFCLNYGMANMPCPFLEQSERKSKCLVYVHRPLICKKFPLEKNPLFHEIKKGSFFDCDNLNSDKVLKYIKKKNRCLNNKQIEKQFIEIFGKEIWKASLEIDKIKTRINKKLKRLEKSKDIDICNMDWIDIKKYKVIDVFEFLEIQKRNTIKKFTKVTKVK